MQRIIANSWRLYKEKLEEEEGAKQPLATSIAQSRNLHGGARRFLRIQHMLQFEDAFNGILFEDGGDGSCAVTTKEIGVALQREIAAVDWLLQ